jgi:DNA-binding NarL/FixJ family response regulator
MKLPQGDGQSVFRLVRQLVPTARTVLITGFRHEMEEQIDAVLKEGADVVCYKPLDVSSLLETVQRLSHHGR